MKVIHVTYPLNLPLHNFDASSVVMAIGDFDGVHLGHQDVIGQALNIAKAHGLPAAVMTFDPHPREVLGNPGYSRYLAPLPKKLELFRELGVDYTFVVRFDRAFSQISPESFVYNVLEKLGVHTVVVGFDFTFGHKAKGTVETLKELGKHKMDVTVVKPYKLHGEKVSSTLIREHLHFGRLSYVKQYTGRNYVITGKVMHGDGRGRTIGFPTANLKLTESYVLPGNGVYAVRVIYNQTVYQGVMNVGVRPTFKSEDEQVSLEVHLLDFDHDLYDQVIEVEFLEFLRPEQKFSNVDALIEQIKLDVERARTIE